MRIAGGDFKGRAISVPPGGRLRPTQDMVREALFGILAPEIPGSSFLDLFAGSGAVGLEALSRRAASACFLERDRRHLDTIKTNAASLLGAASARARASFVCADFDSWIRRRRPEEPGWDVVFADPPYALGEERGCASFLDALAAKSVVRDGGLFAAEMSAGRTSAGECEGWDLLRDRRYGKTRICVWRRVPGVRSSPAGCGKEPA